MFLFADNHLISSISPTLPFVGLDLTGGRWKVRVDKDEAEICGCFKEWVDSSDNGREPWQNPAGTSWTSWELNENGICDMWHVSMGRR